MDTLLVAGRVLVSLAVVLALLWYLQRRIGGKMRTARTTPDAVTVVSRQTITPKASVVVIELEGRRLLLGVTEQSVNVLHADEPVAVPAADDSFAHALENAVWSPDAAPVPALRSVSRRQLSGRHKQPTVLAGSILSPTTWRQTVEALRPAR